jgi:hypothetical protein
MSEKARTLSIAGLLGVSLVFLAAGVWVERGGRRGTAGSDLLAASDVGVLADEDVRLGWPLMSINIALDELYDPITGILANPEGRGRTWERRGAMAYYDAGELRFASDVGVRVHGGGSRRNSPVQSFRLYFRGEYGAEEFGPLVIFDETADPIRRLVAHNDLRVGRMRQARRSRGRRDPAYWHFTNPLAYDISARIGALAPQTKPSRFFLNGEFLGVYVLTEYVTDPPFFESHFGHTQISADPEAMDDLRRWIRELGRPLTMSSVGERIDVENMTNWFLSVLFCGTGDPFQGPGQFHDATRASGNWFWINWDMDYSFRSPDVDMFFWVLEQPGPFLS